MGARERVVLAPKAGRPQKGTDLGWAQRTYARPPLSYPIPKEIPVKSVAHRGADVLPEYTSVTDRNRRFVEVSDSLCKLLGYQREELIGRKYDELTAPRTNDIPTIFSLFAKSGYMHGIWILVHRRGTRILVRYESWLRPDGSAESQMELLGAGA
jgi:PAS domain S-box-containing protein